MYFFTWIWTYYWFPDFLQRPRLGKNWFLSCGPKTYRAIRIQISVYYNMNLIFCLRLPSLEATHLLRHFKWVWPGVPRHAQSYPKSWVSFISRMSWAIKLVFGMWLGVHRSQKFVQSFQVGVVRHPQSDWK